MRTGTSITVSATDRRRLEKIVSDRSAAQKPVWRSEIVLLTARGLGTHAIMARTGKAPIPTEKVAEVVRLTRATHWTARTIASGAYDNTARLWDIATGRELALFATFTDGSWIVLTPEGFFNASEGGARHLNLVRGLEVLSVDQVYDALFRPDLVREALAGDPDGRVAAAAAARLDLGKVLASGLPPRVSGLRSLDGDAVEGDAAELSAEVEDRGGGIGRIEWRVNGIVQGAGGRGLGELEEVEDDGAPALRKRLFLTPGENAISVTVYNSANLIASDPLEISVVSRQGSASPPKLHVLAVGVDDYFDSDLQLNYAVSDARALGAALRRAGRGLYESVEVSYLLDKAVSAEGLGAAFDAVGRAARPQDAFVFFLAGHGKTLDGRYYFLPRDFRYRDDDDLKKTAVSQEQLQSWVSRVSAQKSVLLFDTCESGSLTHDALVVRGLDDKPTIKGYRQHGLFTYVLLEAFAKSDDIQTIFDGRGCGRLHSCAWVCGGAGGRVAVADPVRYGREHGAGPDPDPQSGAAATARQRSVGVSAGAVCL